MLPHLTIPLPKVLVRDLPGDIEDLVKMSNPRASSVAWLVQGSRR